MQPYPSVALIGAASGWGAQRRETEVGPGVLRDLCLAERLQSLGVPAQWGAMIEPMKHASEYPLPVGPKTLPLVAEHAVHLCGEVARILKNGSFPVILGGDHAVAIGTWSGVTTALNAYSNFGLIWVDAHMDSHVPGTSPSHAYHGMPLAVLLGSGAEALVQIGGPYPKLNPKHVCLVDVRSFEPEEKAFLEKTGVRIFYKKEVNERGFAAVMQEAVQIASAGTCGFGMSIDLDVFDLKEAPGVGSPEVGGVHVKEALPVFEAVANHPGFKALEIVEFNPQLDDAEHRTAQLVYEILAHMLPSPLKLLNQLALNS